MDNTTASAYAANFRRKCSKLQHFRRFTRLAAVKFAPYLDWHPIHWL